MNKNATARFILPLAIAIYAPCLSLFYFRYVPLVSPFQMVLAPILLLVLLLTAVNSRWGTMFFIFAFPLINNLPYFWHIFEDTPHAPTALVLFLFYFLGFLCYCLLHRSSISFKEPLSKALILATITIFLSGIITFSRYANFFPFLSNHIYELRTNVFGVTAGGAIMSVVFFSLSYLTGFAFFLVLLNTTKSRNHIKKTLLLLGASTLVSLCFGVLQHLKNIRLGSNPLTFSQGFINATFKDGLSLGAFLAMIIPLILGVSFAFRGIIRLSSFCLALFSFYILLFSGSRSGLLSLIISLILFFALSLLTIANLIKACSVWLKRIDWASLLVVAILIATLLAGIAFRKSLQKDLSSSETLFRTRRSLSSGGLFGFRRENLELFFYGRADKLWKMAALMIKDYPLSGVGIGAYIIESSNYAQRHATEIGTPESAENYLLQVGAELGLVGILLFLWILWEIAKQVRRSYLKIPATDNYRFILIGAVCGIVSFLLMVQTHTFIGSYEIKYTFWLLVGIVFCLGRTGEEEGESPVRKPLFNKTQKIAGAVVLSIFAGVHLWNSTHGLSLRSRAEQFGLKQDFGFYPVEKTNDGREFRWTGRYAGVSLKIGKPVIDIPLLASHPDLAARPVTVKIYLVEDLFRKKKLLAEVTLSQSIWKTYEYDLGQELGGEDILLLEVSRTWNPRKASGVPDPRNLGVALGKIEFKDKMAP